MRHPSPICSYLTIIKQESAHDMVTTRRNEYNFRVLIFRQEKRSFRLGTCADTICDLLSTHPHGIRTGMQG